MKISDKSKIITPTKTRLVITNKGLKKYESTNNKISKATTTKNLEER